MQVYESGSYEEYLYNYHMDITYGFNAVISEWFAVIFVLVFILSIIYANRYIRRCIS